MFSLSNAKLIRINKDGTDGETILSKKTTLELGTSPFYDYHIKDLDDSVNISCEISTDNYGRVSKCNEIYQN